MSNFNFQGSCCRTIYAVSWLSVLVGVIMSFAIVTNGLQSGTGTGAIVASAGFLLIIISTIYMYAISAQRARDIGVNAWFTLVLLIPYANFAYLIFLFFAETGSFNKKD